MYCAIEVRVESPDRSPKPNINVEAEGAPSFKSSTKTDQTGVARFCDTPIDTLIDIRVGQGRCAVTFHAVDSTWRKPARLLAVYESCFPERVMGVCDVILKVRDNNDQPLPDVKLTVPDGRVLKGTFLSDPLGRIFTLIRWHTTVVGKLEKPGYEATAIILDCPSEKSVIEKIIQLNVTFPQKPAH